MRCQLLQTGCQPRGRQLIFTPRASMTSAEPHFEVTLRLPCFATRTPAPATTSAVAVEILKVPLASPPVPQVSTSASRSVPLTSSVESGVQQVGWLRRGWLPQSRQSLRRSRPSCAARPAVPRSGHRCTSREHLGHDRTRLLARERLAMVGNAVEGVDNLIGASSMDTE